MEEEEFLSWLLQAVDLCIARWNVVSIRSLSCLNCSVLFFLKKDNLELCYWSLLCLLHDLWGPLRFWENYKRKTNICVLLKVAFYRSYFNIIETAGEDLSFISCTRIIFLSIMITSSNTSCLNLFWTGADVYIM